MSTYVIIPIVEDAETWNGLALDEEEDVDDGNVTPVTSLFDTEGNEIDRLGQGSFG